MTQKNMSDLAHEKLLAVLDYNPASGAFSWKVKHRNQRKAHPGSIGLNGRLYIHIDRRQHIGHRLAWFYVTGSWPVGNVVPLDGDYLNLAFANLKEETPAETARRAKPRAGTSSGVRGVSWDQKRKKWHATITVDYQIRHLGRFEHKEDAAAAYETARMAMLGSSSQDVEKMVRKRDATTKRARYRALWSRTQLNAGGVVGWANLDDFIVDVDRTEWMDRREIVPIDQILPIGPGNWKWEETLHSKFDTRTPEGRRAYDKAHREAYPSLHRDRFLQRDFGIPLAEYTKMHTEQGGVCGSCRKPETDTRNGKVRWLAVDHCHDTGEIRGLLCGACNKGVGLFNDDPAALRAMADYIERHLAKRAAGSVSNVIPLKKPGAS